MDEKILASPEMQKFFERLLEVKKKMETLSTRFYILYDQIAQINAELNDLIKEKK